VRRSRIVRATVGMMAVASSMSFGHGVSSGASPAGPFVTSERPFLVPILPGVMIEPVLTTGDVIGQGNAAYQMSGVPDGIGWFSSADGVEVFFNHELSPRYDPSGSRVSHVTLNSDGAVTAAQYTIDGTENFEWFCSSTLEEIDGVPWYFTGEESIRSQRRGISIAVDASTGRVVKTPQFGHLSHENIVPVQGLSKAFFGLSEDGFGEKAQLYAYIARSFDGAIRGDEGSLRVWLPDEPVADGNPSSDDIAKGETMSGHFVRIPNAADVMPGKLDARMQEIGAFDFTRIEDQVDDPNDPGVIYFAESGAANQEITHGRIYRLEVDPARPRNATLTVVLDAEAGDDIFSPDNLGISDTALVIQEDRNWKKSGFNRVLVYNLASGTLVAVARTDPDQAIVDDRGPGAWESSGAVDASEAFGPGWWLMDVQAHYTEMNVPDLSLEPNTAVGEGGQLLLVFIPGT
jgi:hypothetical protein